MAVGGNRERFPLFRLLVISGAIFVAVSSEFLPTGLLPDMASDLGVSVSQVGLLVTIFAATVVVSAAPLTALTHRFPRKWLMVAMLGVFAVANLLAALSPNYAALVGTRILGGLAQGLFWAVTGPYASRIVPPRQLSRAMAVTQSGGAAAFVLGVPVGTALGHALGWRLAFAVTGGVIVLFLVLVVVALPPVSHRVELATGEISLPARRDPTLPAIVIIGATILLIVGGQNSFYTYIVPWATQFGGIPNGGVGALLFVYGAAGAIGLLIAGLTGDRFPRGALLMLTGGVVLSGIVLGTFGADAPLVVVLGVIGWSIAFGGAPVLIQTRMLHSTSLRLRDAASAWTTISFNIAIGGGALIGGLELDRWGLAALPWGEVVLVSLGVVWILATDRRRIALQPG
jgi:DHA1 family inner membrane transport protein